jgi:hypothetical protein
VGGRWNWYGIFSSNGVKLSGFNTREGEDTRLCTKPADNAQKLQEETSSAHQVHKPEKITTVWDEYKERIFIFPRNIFITK